MKSCEPSTIAGMGLRSAIWMMLIVAVAGSPACVAAEAKGRRAAPVESTPPVSAPARRLEVVQVRDNIYMLSPESAGNVVVQFGRDGVLLVDTATAGLATAVYEEVRRFSSRPIRIIINTHVHPDSAGGNEQLARKLGGDESDRPSVGNIIGSIPGALIYGHEKALHQISKTVDGKPPVPSAGWPSETFFGSEADIYFNGESIKLYHAPEAHTGGDSIAYFRSSDVIATGDIFDVDAYPSIDLENGGTIDGIIRGLNSVIRIAVPASFQEDGTLIVPGRGRVCDEADIVEYRDMLTLIRDRVRRMKEQGMSFEQVKAGRPSLDYDRRYGSSPQAVNEFLAAVYQSVRVGN
jgi:cyclase